MLIIVQNVTSMAIEVHMKNSSRVTAKGRVTIPSEIRREFGFLPDTEVCFVADKNGRVYLKKVPSKDVT